MRKGFIAAAALAAIVAAPVATTQQAHAGLAAEVIEKPKMSELCSRIEEPISSPRLICAMRSDGSTTKLTASLALQAKMPKTVSKKRREGDKIKIPKNPVDLHCEIYPENCAN